MSDFRGIDIGKLMESIGHIYDENGKMMWRQMGKTEMKRNPEICKNCERGGDEQEMCAPSKLVPEDCPYLTEQTIMQESTDEREHDATRDD